MAAVAPTRRNPPSSHRPPAHHRLPPALCRSASATSPRTAATTKLPTSKSHILTPMGDGRGDDESWRGRLILAPGMRQWTVFFDSHAHQMCHVDENPP